MKLIFAGLLLVAIGALVWLLSAEMATTRDQREQIQKLTSSLADKSKREEFELKERCATQAKKMFLDSGWKLDSPGVTYQSHYNTKLNKCFMTIDHTSIEGREGFTQRTLIDAFEYREYASYDRAERLVRGAGLETTYEVCRLMPSQAAQKACKSVREYETFVAGYME